MKLIKKNHLNNKYEIKKNTSTCIIYRIIKEKANTKKNNEKLLIINIMNFASCYNRSI